MGRKKNKPRKRGLKMKTVAKKENQTETFSIPTKLTEQDRAIINPRFHFMPNCLNTSKISDSIWGEK